MASCSSKEEPLPTYEESFQLLASNFGEIEPLVEEVVLGQNCIGRWLCQPIRFDRDEPPRPRSAMDGFALSSSGELSPRKIVGATHAGEKTLEGISSKEACKIMTGANVPSGADCVVMIEDCLVEGNILHLNRSSLAPLENIRLAGEIATEGDVALVKGLRINSANMATAASCGAKSLSVAAKPRVFILSTGDEIVPFADKPTLEETRNSNLPMLESLVESFGGEVVNAIHVQDDYQLLLETLSEASSCSDVIVTVGGVSKGDRDYLPEIFGELEVNKFFHKVAIRPGKPVFAGKNSSTFFIGLPGNPVSAFVTSHLFVRPLIEAFQTGCLRALPILETIAGDQYVSKWRQDFIVSHVNPDGHLCKNQTTGSADWSSLSMAQAIALVPPSTIIEKGDSIQALLLENL